MPHIVFLDAKTVGNVPNLDKLRSLGQLSLYPSTRPEQVATRIKDCEIVITNKVVLDKSIIEQSPQLKLICVSATGTNNVDTSYAQQRGIPVKNVVGYSTHSVAQHTFTMLFYLLEQVKYYDQYVKSGEYSKNDTFTHLGREFWEIQGKTVGIIGLGTIGKQVAAIATAFGATVIYFSTSGKNSNASYKRVELEELLRTSDVVSIHAPLTPQTKNLLDYQNLCLMKPSAILLNTGRGGIIEENDLVKVLNENLIAAAGLDVLEGEPMIANHPLLDVQQPDKLLITPHIAWSSIEARTTLMDQVYQNIKNFLETGK